MVKESVKKCSHCGHNGHNSRTCNGKVCFKLFGVKIETEKPDLFIRKSKSTGDLATYNVEQIEINDGYLSDGLIHTKKAKAAHEKKKGIPWNEEEHQCFLVGLEKLGKGDWKGISKEYVPTRTPTQVASHAQKYFIRMAPTYKKRRSSLFDTPLKDSAPLPPASPVSPTKTIVEASQQLGLSASQVAPLKKTIETQAQASTSAQVAKLKDASRVLPMAATYGVPSFPHMPYMVGPLPAANVMTTLPFVGVMNYPNQSYIYLPKINENFTNCEPFMYQFSQPLPHGSSDSQACPGSSVTKKDGQELSIGVI